MEKKEEHLNLWIHEMTVSKNRKMNGVIVRLKAGESYVHVTQGQENVKSFSASASWFVHFKTQYGTKNIKFSSSTGHREMKEFFLIFDECYAGK